MNNLCGELEGGLEGFAPGLHVEIDGAAEPFLVPIAGKGADEAQAARRTAPEGAGNMRTTRVQRLSSRLRRSRRLVLLRHLRCSRGLRQKVLVYSPASSNRVWRPIFGPCTELEAGLGAIAVVVELRNH